MTSAEFSGRVVPVAVRGAGPRPVAPAVRLLTPVRALVALLVLLGAGVVAAAPADASTNGSMVALGDSVPSGMHCACTPFPQQYAAQVARHTGRTVRMTNDAVSGATSADVLAQLRTASVQRAVRGSATALVMIGANDFEYAFSGVLAHQRRAWVAFPRVANRVQANVTQAVRVLHELRPGIRVLVADYWNVMKDGRVGLARYGAWGESKAVQATAYANAALRRAAAATGATMVSTYVPFKGTRGTVDPTPLLAADGDHPNARGHAVIAAAFYRAARAG